MTARRWAIAGLVILLAIIIGLLARWNLSQQDAPVTAESPAATAPETPPSISEPAPNTAAKMPEAPSASEASGPTFDVVRVEPDGGAVIAGRAAPDTDVELLSNGSAIETTKANEAGEFVILPAPLAPGSHELTLKVGDVTSRQAVTVSVPEPGKGEVLVVVGEPGKASQVVQAGAPSSPTAGMLSAVPGFVSSPAPQDTPLRIGAVEAGGGRLFVQGSGPPGSRAIIYLNESPLTEAKIGPDGRWSLTVAKGLAGGEYRIRIDQTDAEGKVVSRAEVPFVAEGTTEVAAAPAPETPVVSAPEAASAPATPETAAPAAEPAAPAAPEAAAAPSSAPASEPTANPVVSEVKTVEVRRGDNLWRISRRVYGEGVRYSTIYQANTDQIRDPNRIYPGQIFVTPGG